MPEPLRKCGAIGSTRLSATRFLPWAVKAKPIRSRGCRYGLSLPCLEIRQSFLPRRNASAKSFEAMKERVRRNSSERSLPKAASKRSWAIFHRCVISRCFALPAAVRRTLFARRSFSSGTSSTSPSRTSGFRVWPSAERSITIASARTFCVGSPAWPIWDSRENCVPRSPLSPSTSSYSCPSCRAARRTALLLQCCQMPSSSMSLMVSSSIATPSQLV